MPNWVQVPDTETRAIQYVVSDDRLPGQSQTFRILTPGDCEQMSWWGFRDWRPNGPYDGALSVPAAYRAATLLAGLIGSMPLHAYRQRGGEPTQRLVPTPNLLASPSEFWTRADVVAGFVMDYLFHGNAVGVYTAWDSENVPTALYPVPAETVQIGWGLDGRPRYRIGDGYYADFEVFHVRNATRPGELRGMGVLEVALGTFSLAHEQARQASGLATHGVPTGVLQTTNPDVTTQDLVDAKTAWLTAQSQRTVAALAPGMSFTPVSWNPEEMELAEARKWSDLRIAQLFGLPLRYLQMEVGGLTYSNPTLDSVDLMKFTVDQHLERFEQVLSRVYPRGTWVKFNRDAVMRADTASRYAAYTVALTAGFLTVDEVRELEDLPPLPAEPDPEPEPEPEPPADEETDGEEDPEDPESPTDEETDEEETEA